MNNRQYNFFVYQFLCFLMAIYVINLSSVVWSDSTGQSDIPSKGVLIHTIDPVGILPDGDLVSQHTLPVNPIDTPESTELELDCDFTTLFVFAPVKPAIQHLITGIKPYHPEYNPTHISEINAPPPQFSA